ncbi:hypothetical protein [Nocardia sp. NPDC005366]
MSRFDEPAAVFSFTHAHDAATSVAGALDKNISGVLNVVEWRTT